MTSDQHGAPFFFKRLGPRFNANARRRVAGVEPGHLRHPHRAAAFPAVLHANRQRPCGSRERFGQSHWPLENPVAGFWSCVLGVQKPLYPCWSTVSGSQFRVGSEKMTHGKGRGEAELLESKYPSLERSRNIALDA